MVIDSHDRGGATQTAANRSVWIGRDRIAIGSANGCERTKFVFAVTSFLGDITRFFETGNVFKIYQRPVDTFFATVQIGF